MKIEYSIFIFLRKNKMIEYKNIIKNKKLKIKQ